MQKIDANCLPCFFEEISISSIYNLSDEKEQPVLIYSDIPKMLHDKITANMMLLILIILITVL